MLIVRFKYRQLLALILASFLLYSWVIKEAHHLFVAHEHQHCDFHFAGQKHFHDADHDAEDCLFCLTTFTEFTSDESETYSSSLLTMHSNVPIYAEDGHRNHPAFHKQWRGPPLI